MVKNIPFTLVAVLALVLSLWIVFQTFGNSKLQQDIQTRQDRIQAVQSEIQTLQLKNNNIALGVFLQKHGVQVRPSPPKSSPTPSPKPAKGVN